MMREVAMMAARFSSAVMDFVNLQKTKKTIQT